LIEVAAGIKEYNDKKDVAMGELQKVEEKINNTKLILSERAGFLSELEKEKNDAERYTQLSTSIKQANYTLLKIREKEIESKYTESINQIRERSGTKQKLDETVSGLDLEISKATNERDRLSKGLNAKSTEMGSTSRYLEEVNKNIAINTTQLSSTNESIKGLKERALQLQTESKKLKAKEKENAETLKKLGFEIEVKGKNLPEHIFTTEDNKEAATLTERFNTNYAKVEELESKLIAASSNYTQFTSEYESLSRAIMEMHQSMNEQGAKRSSLTSTIKSSKEKLLSFEKSKSEVERDITKENETLKALNARLDALNVENINLREALVHAGRDSPKIGDTLKKEISKGFHGKAQDICTYDDKYAPAVESAAGARFNYLVVDSIDVANDAIGILKEKKLGRASFIPINELVVRETKGPSGLKPLLDYIKFDKKYDKVFSYIFANTYLVSNIKEAQKLGVGTSRFVTIDGDIVEPSGIVSGGSMRPVQSAYTIESRLKKLDAERKETFEKINETNATLEAIRKKIGAYQTDIINYEIELKHALAGENDANRIMDSLDESVKKSELTIKVLKEKIEIAKVEKERAETSIKLLRDENMKFRGTLDVLLSAKGKTAKSKDEADKIKVMRTEVENLKLNGASITKENEMLKSRMEELDKEIKECTLNANNLKSKTEQLETDVKSLNKQKEELKTTLETHDKKTSGMFKELQAIDDKIAKLGMEKGKLSAELDKINGILIETEGRKAQMQTRLSDIKAELVSYTNMEMILNSKSEELEKQLIISKDTLEKLGVVNLKAPEMYEAKKKDVEDAQGKMETLENEKNSIMSMIEQIDTKKLGVFTDTLNTVNENFKKLYGYIFDGSANLYLREPKDPFNTGLEISIEINKKKHNPDLLSGGQKSLIAIMLVFAIQMRVPMSFYIFDEIDIALDKDNSKKLSKLIKELSQKSQFIVVSHNDTLIAAADTAVGVVNKANESQVVGVQLASK
jgi:chromosome segregation protein